MTTRDDGLRDRVRSIAPVVVGGDPDVTVRRLADRVADLLGVESPAERERVRGLVVEWDCEGAE